MIRKSRERLIVEALERIFGRTTKAIITDGKIIEWLEPGEVQPTNDQIEATIQKIVEEEPMILLREERDRLLAKTDWRLAPDYSFPDQSKWIKYRQQLREVPQQIREGNLPMPTLSENDGNLVFDHWPLEPNE